MELSPTLPNPDDSPGSGPGEPSRPGSRKTRKRTGCFTCRRRKKACDERHPVCESCARLDIPCVYPKTGSQVRPRPGIFGKRQKEHGRQESKVSTIGSGRNPSDTAIDQLNNDSTGNGPANDWFNGTADPKNLHIPNNQEHTSNRPDPVRHPSQSFQHASNISAHNHHHHHHHQPSLISPHGIGTSIPTYHFDPNQTDLSSTTTRRPSDGVSSSNLTSLPLSNEETKLLSNHTDPYDPLPLPSFDPMQPTGHPLTNPTEPSADPITFDRTLAEFIRTMEQSESEWAQFVMSASEAQEFGEGTGTTGGNGSGFEEGMGGKEDDAQGGMFEEDLTGQGNLNSLHLPGLPKLPNGNGNGDQGQGSISANMLSTITSQSHVTSSLAGTSLPRWIWAHVPVLIDYFVNGFGPIISVLGAPSKHSLTQSLLPVAATSPLLLPALIGWSASHLAKIGEPYASIAKIATDVTDRRVQSLLMAGGATSGEGAVGDVSLEDKLWIVLMLGGIEICKGSVNRWSELLPKIRNLVTLLSRSRPDGQFSETQLSLALNCIYHDISWSLACKEDPKVPLGVYEGFIRKGGSRPDVYLGICAPIYQILGRITELAAESNPVYSIEDPDERFELLSSLLSRARSLTHQIDLLEISSRTLGYMSEWQASEKEFNPQPLISTFQAFKYSAHAYLRQCVFRAPAGVLDAQVSVTRMLASLETVLNTPSQSQILFPLFVLGVDAIRPRDRERVKRVFERLEVITGTGNIRVVHALVERVWGGNEGGRRWVDWREEAGGMGVSVSFA